MKRTVLSVLMLLVGICASGQDSAKRDILRNPPGALLASPRTYGTTQDSLQRIGVQDFAPSDSTTIYNYTDGNTTFLRYSATAGFRAFIAHPHLPSGALLTGVEFAICDIDPVGNVQSLVLATDSMGSGLNIVGLPVLTTGTPGCDPVFVDLSSENFVVDNATSQILLDVVLSSGDATQSFAGATVFYRLQVGPAPPVASFNDVPVGHPFFQFIEALKSSGITGGCQIAPPLYCPDNFVTRGQMAVFLAKALGLQFP
jgi:hypothetical protein